MLVRPFHRSLRPALLPELTLPSSPRTIFGDIAVRRWLDRRRGVLIGTAPDVASWADQSIYGSHSVQLVDPNRPHQAAEGDPIVFDGALQYLSTPDAASLDATTSLLVGVAVKPDVVSGNHCIIAKSATGVGEWSAQTNGTAIRFFCGTPGLSWSEGGTLVAGTRTRLIWGFNGDAVGNTLRLRQWQDGVQQSPSYPALPIPSAIIPSVNPVTDGAFSSPAQFFDGEMFASVIVIGVPSPTDAQIAALDAYLARA